MSLSSQFLLLFTLANASSTFLPYQHTRIPFSPLIKLLRRLQRWEFTVLLLDSSVILKIDCNINFIFSLQDLLSEVGFTCQSYLLSDMKGMRLQMSIDYIRTGFVPQILWHFGIWALLSVVNLCLAGGFRPETTLVYDSAAHLTPTVTLHCNIKLLDNDSSSLASNLPCVILKTFCHSREITLCEKVPAFVGECKVYNFSMATQTRPKQFMKSQTGQLKSLFYVAL